MLTTRVAVTIDTDLLQEIDSWVEAGVFPSRSRAVQVAIARLKREQARQTRLHRALTHLDPNEERALADETFVAEAPWPAY